MQAGLRTFQGYTEFCVNCILKIHSIFKALSSECAKVLMHQESKYAIYSYKGFQKNSPSYISYRVLNIPRF